MAALLAAFCLFYRQFDRLGGFCWIPSYPSPSALWIVLGTFEGLAYAVAIAWYDSSFKPHDRGASRLIGRIGVYSYSIYLLHVFVVFKMSHLVHAHLMDISSLHWALAWSAACFMLMVPIGYLSYRFVEATFLRLRRPYLRPRSAASA